MKKLLLSGIILLGSTMMFAQKYTTRTGKITFDATSKTSPEKIKAINTEVGCIVDAEKGHIVFSLAQKSFKFEKELMEEHFNENYMESEKFPKATFDGNITNVSDINWKKNGTYTAKVTGKLSLHGETKEVSVSGSIEVDGNKIKLDAKFPVALIDYKIMIPGAVADKIAKIANVILDAELTQK